MSADFLLAFSRIRLMNIFSEIPVMEDRLGDDSHESLPRVIPGILLKKGGYLGLKWKYQAK